MCVSEWCSEKDGGICDPAQKYPDSQSKRPQKVLLKNRKAGLRSKGWPWMRWKMESNREVSASEINRVDWQAFDLLL